MNQTGQSELDSINLKLLIEYDGKNYSGWQRQKKQRSIQQTIEDALKIIFRGGQISLNGSGRTDAGVHAYSQCANFKISKSKFESVGIKRLKISLNALVPDDIVVHEIKIVPPRFHARFSAKKREYIYRISETPKAIERDTVYFIKDSFDINTAKEFCKVITGNHSFRSLCKNKEDDHGFRCIVYKADVKRKRDGIIEFTISANRFLHSMVRALTGAMIKTATGKLTLAEFTKKFKKGDEIKIQYLPSNALFLSKVTY